MGTATMTISGSPTILIVDDNASMRALYTATLTRANYHIISAVNGQEALEVVLTSPVDCLIIDSKMPIMSGPQVIKTLRSLPQFSLLPIIMVTGSDEPSDMIVGLDLGANDYLVKPVDPAELLARIRAHLRVNVTWLDATRAFLEQRIALIDAMNQLDPSAQLADQAAAIVERLNAVEDIRQVALYAFSRRDSAVLLAGSANHPLNSDNETPRNVAQTLRAIAERGPGLLRSGVEERWWSASNSDNVFSSPLGEREQALGVLILTGKGATFRESSGLSLSVDAASIVGTLLGPQLRKIVGQASSAEEIRATLRDPGTQIAFQPIVNLQSLEIEGFEALARFADRVRPDHKLSDARAVGIRDEIELELIRLAISSSGHLPPTKWLSVNLSAAALVDHPELDYITRKSPRQIVIELTEHEPVADYSRVRNAIASLSGGPRLSIDDAGAGYASLRHIFELAPSFVKLDREWVAGIDADPIRLSLVEALVSFSQRSGALLIAEGIETAAELKTLVLAGVNLGQGYLLGKPVTPPGEPMDLVTDRLKNALRD